MRFLNDKQVAANYLELSVVAKKAYILQPFIAIIGPPRILLGALAFIFGIIGIGFDVVTHGGFNWSRNIQELFALVFSVVNIGEEVIKSYFRHKYSIVEMNSEGIFDRRIMKRMLKWDDIEWIDPQPAGLPDRLRVMGAAELTTFGTLRNFLIRTFRQIPKGETVITFGGLNKAASQATTWIADNKPRMVSDVWRSIEHPKQLDAPTAHNEILLSARVYFREWVGWIVSGAGLAVLIASVLPVILMTMDNTQSIINLPIWVIFVICLVFVAGIWFGVLFVAYRVYQKLDDKLIVISQAGFSDARISNQFIGWQHIESISFQYRNMGRLINETAPVFIQFREGFTLLMPNSRLFWPSEILRRIATPELRMLGHFGTTTSASEIIETLQRYNVAVAIRETSRG